MVRDGRCGLLLRSGVGRWGGGSGAVRCDCVAGGGWLRSSWGSVTELGWWLIGTGAAVTVAEDVSEESGCTTLAREEVDEF